MNKRRAFLAALIAVSGVAVCKFARSTDEDAIATILYKRLDYLRLDPAGVARFSKDFAALSILSSRRLRAAELLWPVYRRLPSAWQGRWTDHVKYAEERVVSNYLISSDFFTQGADESRVVHYLRYYDARSHACGNPFYQAVQV